MANKGTEISKLFTLAGEETFKSPLLTEAHRNAQEILTEVGLGAQFGSWIIPKSYAERQESIVEQIAWNVGLTEFRVYPILVTELASNAIDSERWERVDSTDFSPIADNIYRATGSSIRIAGGEYRSLWSENKLPRWLPNKSNLASWEFHYYVRPVGADANATPFLRIPVAYHSFKYGENKENTELFISYLRFWEKGYPKPFGKGGTPV